jgi:hypothetical protein
MRPWVLTQPYLNKYCLVSRPMECLHSPQVPSRALELLVALLVQTQHVTAALSCVNLVSLGEHKGSTLAFIGIFVPYRILQRLKAR